MTTAGLSRARPERSVVKETSGTGATVEDLEGVRGRMGWREGAHNALR